MGAPRPQAVPLDRGRRVGFLGRAALLLATVGVIAWGPGRLLHSLSPDPSTVGGLYREAVAADSLPLDPLAVQRAPRDPDLTPLLYRGLIQVDEHGEIRPDLAERWDVSSEGKVFMFHLRPGLRWDDGEPLTSADVIATVQRAAGGTGPGGQRSFWSDLAVRAIGPATVEFSLREPLGAFLEHAALPIIAAHAPPAEMLPLEPDATWPAASGPFRLRQSATSDVVLERNSLYWGPAAKLDQLEFRLFPSRQAALEALLAGEVDGLADISPAERPLLSGSDRLEVYEVPEFNKYGLLVLNSQSPVFRDRLVRRAVFQAIDREAVIRLALDGAGEPAFGPLSPLSWAFDLSLSYPSHDLAAARASLDSAGWLSDDPAGTRRRRADRLSATLLTSDAAPRLLEAAEVARQLWEIGIQIDVQAMPMERLRRSHLETGEFEMALLGRWLTETDPDQFALWHSTQTRGIGANDAGLSSPEVDEWLEAGRRATSPEVRGEAYRRFQAAWAEELPAVLLYYPHASYALSRELRGVRAEPLPDASWRLRRLPEWYREATPAAIDWTAFVPLNEILRMARASLSLL